MSKPIIEVKNLSKKYKIGIRQPYYSLRDSLMGVISNPLRFLRLKNLYKDNSASDEFYALQNISFKVIPGEIIGIIGRNGAGKTTLLKLISKITPPTQGEIILRGRVASLLEVGTGFHPELTGRENIFLNGAILGMRQKEIKKKFDEIVAFAEVEKFLDTPVKHYSSGMYMRLAFAIAAHLDPEILIVDEVLAIGDIQFQKKCLGKMEGVRKEGRTIIFVSHNMAAIRSLCGKTIWLDKGLMKKYDHTENTIKEYLASTLNQNSYILFPTKPNKRAFIKSVKMLNKLYKKTLNFSIGERPIVEICFVINEPVKGCHLACIVTTYDGYYVFSTADTDKFPNLLIQRRKPGQYKARVKLPLDHLNAGTYNLAVGIGIPGVESYDRQEALSFTIHDTGNFVSMKDDGRRAGLLIYKASWEYL